jgi:hypothetical protein
MEVYYPLRRLFGHRLAWAAERAWAWLTRRKLCDVCGDTARYTVEGLPHCRPCAWNANGGQQPADDPDNEPPGAGADPWGRPDPATHPEYWRE